MKARSSLVVLVLGLLVGSAPAIAQDTIFISLGEFLIHPDAPDPNVLPTNTPGQVVGGMTGTHWNLINTLDEAPFLNYSDNSLSPANAFSGKGQGGGSEGVYQGEFDPGVVAWSVPLANNGGYGAAPDDPNQLSGILSGPAGTHGFAWQKTAGVRIADLPQGSYEVYATGVPYDRFGGFGAGFGDDLNMYIGTQDNTETRVVFEDDPLAGDDPNNPTGLITNADLQKTHLTHDNYATWELGDNYARGIVTISEANEFLVVGIDGVLTPTPTLATIEIRKVVLQDGDFDVDGDVDGADFLKWQRDLGDAANLALWEANYGSSLSVPALTAVPEPASVLVACVGLLSVGLIARQRRPLT